METVSPILLVKHFCLMNGCPNIKLDLNAIAIFMSIAQTPTEVRNICKVICSVYKEKGDYTITTKDLTNLFVSPSFSLCLEILKAYVRRDKAEIMRLFIEIWNTGISYEDFLHELTSSVHQMGIIQPITNQIIHQLILKGWISFAQGKTHSLDLMRLFLDQRPA
jgi:DNA polymerase III gamma/tau subunit